MGNQPDALAEPTDVGTLYRRYVTMVRSRAREILRNDADAQDLAQEVFVKFLKHRKQGGSERQVAGLLFCMTTNLALNRIRDRKRRGQLLERHRQVLEPTSGSSELGLDARTILGLVSYEVAQVAIYYYVDGMDQQEISDLTGIPRRTVSRRLEKFRQEGMQRIQSKEKL